MRSKDRNRLRILTALTGGFGLAFALGAPFALGAAPGMPSGGSVVSGSAAIATPSSTSTLITQSSQKALINWKDFSIGSGSSVTFQQPNSASITLNRVTGPNASAINGTLSANGQVWIINGNGILFGQGARVDVGGLIATTSDMRDADFAAGNYQFGIPGNPNATVVNQGSIKTGSGGSAVLSASRVVNQGVIQADLGKVVLGGASAFSVDFDGDNLIRYAITAPVPETPKDADGKPAPDLVSNSGSIAAQGGKVLLTARAARSVVDNVINSTGIVEATSAKMENGEIVLDAGEGGTVNVAGTLDASGANAGETGGKVALLADTVTVADGAKLNASGDAGGGTIAVGGDLHGAGPDANATAVTVGAASIAADATGNGNGGTVAVYSTGATKVAGSLSAKGGALGGNGGTVETSGENLSVTAEAKVDTSAPKGVTGNWLLDPTNVDVVTGGGSDLGGDTVDPSAITNALATTNVQLTATNDITVSNQVTYTSGNSLTFNAGANVDFFASVQNSGLGSILVTAGGDVTVHGVGGGVVAIGAKSGTTTINGASLSLTAADAVAQLGYHGAGGGDIVVNATGGVSLTGGNTQLDYAQLGNGHAFGNLPGGGNVTGNISVTAGGVTTFTSTQGGGIAWLGNAAGQGFIESGDLTLIAGDIDDESNALRKFNDMIVADLGTSATPGTGGNVTVGITNPDLTHPLLTDPDHGTTKIDDSIIYNSPHDFTVMTAGNLYLGGTVENSGAGAIVAVAGWNGVTAAADVSSTPGSYGNDFNDNPTTLTISGTVANGNVSVGSRVGSTSIFTNHLVIEADNGYAQLGYHGAGSGSIAVEAIGDLTLQGGSLSADYASIGNGDALGNLPGGAIVSGDINLHVGGLSSFIDDAGIAWIGNVGPGGNVSENVTNASGNVTLITRDTDHTGPGPELRQYIAADIGNSDTTGGNIVIGFTDPQGSQGPDQVISYESPHSLTVMTTGDLFFGASVQNSGSGAMMGVAGWDGVTAAANVIANNAYGIGGHSIVVGGGESALGVAVGSKGGTTTLAGGVIGLDANASYAQIGYHGSGATGGINLFTRTLHSPATPTAAGCAVGSGNICVSSGSVAGAYAQIGHLGLGTSGSAEGDITIRAAGNVILSAGGRNGSLPGMGENTLDQAYAQIGHGDASESNGSVDTFGANNNNNAIDVRATGEIFVGSSSHALSPAWIGNIGAAGIARGNVTVVTAKFDHSNNGGDRTQDIIAADILGGNVTIGITNDPNGVQIDSDVFYDSSHDLTILTTGSIEFDSPFQNSGTGNMTFIAGWGGNLNAPGDFGHNGGSVLIGGANAEGSVGVGSKGGTTLVTGDNIVLQAVHGSAQIGFNGAATGNIVVGATGDVTLTSGGDHDFTQIGHGGYLTQGSVSGAILVSAHGDVTLTAGSGAFAYTQIGNGGAETNVSATQDFSETGSVFVVGSIVNVNAGSGSAAYAQIGDGGFEAGKSLGSATATFGGGVTVHSDALTLTGNGTNAYAQIGNGGGLVDSNSAAGAHGTISGDIDVVAAPNQNGSITMTAGSGAGAYVQIGNGGYSINTQTAAPPGNFTIGGDISVSDLLIQGGNQGANSYGQIGNGDASLSGTGNVSGDIDINTPPNGTVTLTNGTAPNSPAMIGNAIGHGTVTGTVTGFGQQPAPSPTDDPAVLGTLTVLTQNPFQNAPVTTATTPPPAQGPMGPAMMMASSMSMGTVESQEEPAPSDAVASSVGSSLSGEPGTVPSRTISLIGGLLRQFAPPPGASTPRGVPPADQDYSSWGNEAFWQ